jgi:hypothetical protein
MVYFWVLLIKTYTSAIPAGLSTEATFPLIEYALDAVAKNRQRQSII